MDIDRAGEGKEWHAHAAMPMRSEHGDRREFFLCNVHAGMITGRPSTPHPAASIHILIICVVWWACLPTCVILFFSCLPAWLWPRPGPSFSCLPWLWLAVTVRIACGGCGDAYVTDTMDVWSAQHQDANHPSVPVYTTVHSGNYAHISLKDTRYNCFVLRCCLGRQAEPYRLPMHSWAVLVTCTLRLDLHPARRREWKF